MYLGHVVLIYLPRGSHADIDRMGKGITCFWLDDKVFWIEGKLKSNVNVIVDQFESAISGNEYSPWNNDVFEERSSKFRLSERFFPISLTEKAVDIIQGERNIQSRLLSFWFCGKTETKVGLIDFATIYVNFSPFPSGENQLEREKRREGVKWNKNIDSRKREE